MENIWIKILQTLPRLEPKTLDSLMKLLEDLGVAAEDDLKYVRESDLTAVLRPIQARKVIEAWKQIDSLPITSMLEVNVPSPPPMTSMLEVIVTSPPTSENSESSLPMTSVPKVNVASPPTLENSESSLPMTSMPEVNVDNPPTSENSESSSLAVQSVPYDWAENFVIPWQNMSDELMKSLKEGKRPTPKGRREFINTTAKNIFKICEKPGKKNLSKIARKAIETYPSFSDVWCNEIVAGGCESLTRSFVIKFENLNRRDAFSSLKRSLKEENSNNERKLSASSIYGCLNWQPKMLPIGESDESQTEKQNQMIKISLVTKPGEELSKQTLTLLEETYYSQRKDINTLKNITFLLNSWPLLFSEQGFFQHFHTLTGVDIPELMQNSIQTKASTIIHFFKSLSNKKNSLKETFQRYKKTKSKVSDLEIAVSLLLQHFSEKSEAVFKSIDSSVTAKDVESMLILPSTPCLISSGDGSSISYMISVNKKIICEKIKSFETGFFMMFSAYYILNIDYAEMACVTLEFIQRCFFRMNPDRGSKASKRRKSTMNQKVLTLLNKLMDFEWY